MVLPRRDRDVEPHAHLRALRHGVHTSCARGAWWGSDDERGFPVDGGRGDRVRVPPADGTLVAPPDYPDDALVPSLLTLSDVMATGHHAAVAAGVDAGTTVAPPASSKNVSDNDSLCMP